MLLDEAVAVVVAAEGQTRWSQHFFGRNVYVTLAWPCCAFGRWFPITVWHGVIKKSINGCVCTCQNPPPPFPKLFTQFFWNIVFLFAMHNFATLGRYYLTPCGTLECISFFFFPLNLCGWGERINLYKVGEFCCTQYSFHCFTRRSFVWSKLDCV